MQSPDAVRTLLAELKASGWMVAVAEADTGGLLLAWLTAEPGSSTAVLGGIVPYADALKRSFLGVPAELLAQHGAVSAAAAEAMARGILDAAGADLGLASTGIAGPGGATPTKPIGLAFIAAATRRGTRVREHHWPGDRAANRQASATAMLHLALEVLRDAPGV